MKKVVLVLTTLALMFSVFSKDVVVASSNSSNAFSKGSKILGLGGSLSNSWYGLFGPTIHMDFAINEMVSVGGDINFRFRNEESTSSYNGYWVDGYLNSGSWVSGYWHSYKTTYHQRRWVLSPTVRGAFHPFGLPALRGKVAVAKKLDTYIGSKIGVRILYEWYYHEDNESNRIDGSYWNEKQSYVYFSFYLGAKYFFSNNFALFAEFDWQPDRWDVDVARFDFGVAFKF